ncbi:DUF2155 domain-containing protein [Rhodoligotrophos defluvii]|uniref:DUF2155 domain-containing protein n=1 Tax=Rhodoligotrophos defluvii TaxID=2561934 RepID=UPI0010CA01C3|nr:DUF2155 domain-containing protein [Rhodoligotrophos defluvii]
MPSLRFSSTRVLAAVFGLGAVLGSSPAARAEAIANPVAVFSGLDKITATITSFHVPINSTKRFGQIEVTPRVCYSRPPTEEPKTSTFVEIDELEEDGSKKRIFSGWMFAESPGLNALEHPVFDVWLTGCTDPSKAPEAAPDGGTTTPEMAPDEIPKDTD